MNEEKTFMSSSFGDEKLSKSKELNSAMTIRSTSNDALTSRLSSLGGND